MKTLLTALLILLFTGMSYAGEVTINLTKQLDATNQYRRMVDAFLDSMEYDFNHPMNWCEVTPTGDISINGDALRIGVEAKCDGDEKNARFQRLIDANQWAVGNGWGGPLYVERMYLQKELSRRFPHISLVWVSQQLMYRVVVKPEYDIRGSEQTAVFFGVRINGNLLRDKRNGHIVKFPLRTFLFQAFTVPNTEEYEGLSGIYSEKSFSKKATITYHLDQSIIDEMIEVDDITISIDNCDRIWVMPEQKGYMSDLPIKHPIINVNWLTK